MENLKTKSQNKRTETIFLGFLILGLFVFGWLAYQNLNGNLENKNAYIKKNSTETLEFNIKVAKNTWQWDPKEIKVKLGSWVIVNIINEDSYNHGFAISELRVDKVITAQKTTHVEFLANQIGEFTIFCSVLCGKGHFTQTGKLIISP